MAASKGIDAAYDGDGLELHELTTYRRGLWNGSCSCGWETFGWSSPETVRAYYDAHVRASA